MLNKPLKRDIYREREEKFHIQVSVLVQGARLWYSSVPNTGQEYPRPSLEDGPGQMNKMIF